VLSECEIRLFICIKSVEVLLAYVTGGYRYTVSLCKSSNMNADVQVINVLISFCFKVSTKAKPSRRSCFRMYRFGGVSIHTADKTQTFKFS